MLLRISSAFPGSATGSKDKFTRQRSPAERANSSTSLPGSESPPLELVCAERRV